MRDLYSVLNLPRRASGTDIKAAYWALAKQFHPDVNSRDQEGEWRTKEINRAYEILGNPDARAAYDVELARQCATARRSFWRSAATGAATFILTASISMAVVWKQHELQTRSAKNETQFVKAPAQEQAAPQSDRSEHSKRSADPSEPMSAPLPRQSSELPASTSSEITSTAPTDGDARTQGAPAPSSVIVSEQAPNEVERSRAPSEPSRVDLPEGPPVQRVPQATDRHPPRRTELANVVSPEGEAKQLGPTATIDQKSSGESPRRDGDRKAEAVGSIHKSKKRLSTATDAATSAPNKLQGSERKPRLVSTGAMALRWPSADEPFVNLGARSK